MASKPNRTESRPTTKDLVQLINVLFGVVLAGGLTIYRSVIVHPFASANRVPLLALLAIYLTSIMSWVSWHKALGTKGYREAFSDTGRFATDIAIVVLYAYTLFTIELLQAVPGTRGCPHCGRSLVGYLLGYVVIFGLYLIWGFLRMITLSEWAPRFVFPILSFGVAFVVLVALYDARKPSLPSDRVSFNEWTLVLVIVLTLLYRLIGKAVGEYESDD